MVAIPSATPVTRPDEFTVAVATAELDQVTVAVTGSPAAFRGVATKAVVAPMSTVADGGATMTVATVVSGPGPTPFSPPHDVATRAARPARMKYERTKAGLSWNGTRLGGGRPCEI
jgi:hypothetical protein